MADAIACLYGESVSVSVRFGGLEGSLLYKKIIAAYGTSSGSGTRIHFFSPAGDRLLFRHPLNSRRQDTVLERYVEGVLSYGILPNVRGAAVAVPKSTTNAVQEVATSGTQYYLIGHATLAEAVYEAVRREPNNPQVQETLKNGLSNALVLSIRTPRDVLTYLKEEHNRWHAGAGMGLPGLLEMCENAGRAWSEHASANGITVKSCGTLGPTSYQKQMEKFVLENFPKIEKKYNFSICTPFLKNMRSWGIHTEFVAMLGSRALFLEPRLQGASGIAANWACMHSMHKIMGVLEKFTGAHDANN